MAALLMVTQFLCQPCFLGWTWGDTSGCPGILLALVERGKIRDHSTPRMALTWEHSFREMGVPLSPRSCSTQWEVTPQVCHLILCFYFSNTGLKLFPTPWSLPESPSVRKGPCFLRLFVPMAHPPTHEVWGVCVWFGSHWDRLLFIL